MRLIILLLAFQFASSFVVAQSAKLVAFSNLAESTWVSDGKQLGGHDGKTVKEFTLGLDGEIIKVKTFTTDPKTLEFGLRNEGIRIFNKETSQVEFYEFDKLGGVSKGKVIFDEKDIHYQYKYGDLILRDSWIYLSTDEYDYSVCSITTEGECEQIYHKGKFVRQKK
ncbi:hypothetical protein [Ekhidna sp.]